MYIQYVIKRACSLYSCSCFSSEMIHKWCLFHEKCTVIVITEGRIPVTCHLLCLTLRTSVEAKRWTTILLQPRKKSQNSLQYTILNKERFGQRNRRSIKRNWLEFEEQEDDESEKKARLYSIGNEKGLTIHGTSFSSPHAISIELPYD